LFIQGADPIPFDLSGAANGRGANLSKALRA